MFKRIVGARVAAALLVCVLAAAAAPAQALDQWASSVIAFSSQYSTGGWSAAQVVGPPNTATYGDIDTSWAPSSANGTSEFLTVGYDMPVYANSVMVRETYGNGFVTQIDVIDLNNVYHTVWTGTDTSAQGTPVNAVFNFTETAYAVRGVRVYIDTNHSPSWEEIDAIQLSGPIAPGPADQWASSVIDFSSEYNSTSYSAAQALGVPDVFSNGDQTNTWTPATMNGGAEHISVGYTYPVYATGVTVRETCGEGFVTQIDLLDTNNVYHTIWSGTDPSPGGAVANYLVTFTQTTYVVKGVRVYTDTNHNLNTYEEIDAIQLHGQTTNFSSLALNPTNVGAGKTSTATVTLYSPAPPGGYTLTLSSSDTSIATVPASVTVGAGATTATFTVKAVGAAAANTPVTITASAGTGDDRSAILLVQPATLSSVSLTPPTQVGGKNVVGKATLSGPAGTGGVTVTLTNANSAATVPATATVLAGAASGTFTITTNAVTSNVTGLVSGKLGAVTKTANLTVTPPTISSMALAPASQTGGKVVVGKVTLTGAAGTGGVVVSLACANSAATVPASVTVLAGATTATFNITTVAVTANTTGLISGTVGAVTKSLNLTVIPPALSKLALVPPSVMGGSNSVATVTLTGKAAAAVVVNVSTSNSAVAQPVNGSNVAITTVTVPVGADHVTFTVKTMTVGVSTPVTIGANLGAVTKNVTLTVHP